MGEFVKFLSGILLTFVFAVGVLFFYQTFMMNNYCNQVTSDPTVSDETQPVAEVKSEAVAEVKSEAVAEVKSEAVTEVKSEAVAEVKSEAVAEVKSEAVAEVKPEAVTEVKPEAVTEVKPEAVTEVKSEAVTEAQPVGESPTSSTVPAAEAVPKTTEQFGNVFRNIRKRYTAQGELQTSCY